MRRIDLVVGESYYCSRARNWEEFDDGQRAVVVDARPWRWGTWDREPRQVSSGTGVLVDIFDTDKPMRRVVGLAHLRGPWLATKAAAVEASKARRLRYAEEQAASEEEHQIRQLLVDRAASLGLVGIHQRNSEFTISVSDLATLLDAYAEWREGP